MLPSPFLLVVHKTYECHFVAQLTSSENEGYPVYFLQIVNIAWYVCKQYSRNCFDSETPHPACFSGVLLRFFWAIHGRRGEIRFFVFYAVLSHAMFCLVGPDMDMVYKTPLIALDHIQICDFNQKALGLNDTHIDQSKVVFVNGELLWTNVFLQSRGIGALQREKEQRERDEWWNNQHFKSQVKHLAIVWHNTNTPSHTKLDCSLQWTEIRWLDEDK